MNTVPRSFWNFIIFVINISAIALLIQVLRTNLHKLYPSFEVRRKGVFKDKVAINTRLELRRDRINTSKYYFSKILTLVTWGKFAFSKWFNWFIWMHLNSQILKNLEEFGTNILLHSLKLLITTATTLWYEKVKYFRWSSQFEKFTSGWQNCPW